MSRTRDPIRLTIRLDSEAEAAAPIRVLAGEEVSGEVQVDATTELAFREVILAFGWETQGRGNVARGRAGEIVLDRDGQWPAGSSRQYRFTEPAPTGPVSYGGEILSVVWWIEVKVVRPLKRDIKTARPVELVAESRQRGVSLGPTRQKKRELEAEKGGHKGVALAAGAILLLAGVAIGAILGWPSQGVQVFLVGGLFMVGGILVTWGLWGRLGRGKLGEPSVEISGTEFHRGDEVRVNIRILPTSDAELRSLKAALECEERTTKGRGRYATQRREVVHEELAVLARDKAIDMNRGIQKGAIFRIPPDAPCTFSAPDNQVAWWLRIEADVAGWPDWKENHLLTVRP